ncbi:MAG: LysE family translocator [Burkholderiales bacterium]
MTPLFLKGLAFGFVLAATVGPMWMLCFRRTLASGALAGFVSGMGIAAADAIYGAVAAFGITAVSAVLLAHRFWLGLLGGGFLIYLGIRALIAAPPAPNGAATEKLPLPAAFLSTLGLTLANPPTILAFAAIFAGLGLGTGAGYAGAATVVLGVFLGSASWWVILALGAARLRARLGAGLLRGLNVVSGIVILAFALWQLARLV